jgi:TPR repeat protein
MYPDPASPLRRPSEEREQARGVRSQPADAESTAWRRDQTSYVPPQHEVEGVVAAARRVMRGSAQAQAGEESSERTRPPKPGESRRAGLAGRIRMPSRLFIATLALALVGATFAIATVMRKQTVEAPAQHRLLAPPESTPGGQPGHDAERRDSGRETNRASEPEEQQEQGSGERVPALKQRTGEPPQKMHALAVDQLEWGKAQLRAFQASQAAGGGGGAAITGAEIFARSASKSAPQETGSIGAAADTAHTGSALPPAAVGPHSLRVAAAGGDPSAAFEVGTRLAEGRGVTQDFEQAVLWYKRAAARGFAPAQYRLATLLESGLGVSSDLAAARGWYLKAAEQGHAKAMHNAAVLSIGGDRGQADYAAAIDWFTKAAEHGIADSQYNLGVLYETGLGSARDLKLAYQWFALAARGGDEEAVRRRDLLRARIGAEDFQEAERAIRSWRPKPVDPLVNEPRTAGSLWQRDASARAAAGDR